MTTAAAERVAPTDGADDQPVPSWTAWLVLPVLLCVLQALAQHHLAHADPTYGGAFVAAVGLAFARRSPRWAALVPLFLLVWATADVLHPTGGQFEVEIVAAALLWAVALTGVHPGPRPGTTAGRWWHVGAQRMALLFAAGSLVLDATGRQHSGAVAAGFGLALVVAHAAVPDLRTLIDRRGGALGIVGVVGVALGAFQADLASGSVLWCYGVGAAVVVVAVASGPAWVQLGVVVGWLGATPYLLGARPGASAVALGASAVVGAELVAGVSRRRLTRGAPLVLWLLPAAFWWLGSDQLGAAARCAVLVGVVAVVTVIPWPASLVAMARAEPVTRWWAARSDAILARLAGLRTASPTRLGAIWSPAIAFGRWWGARRWPVEDAPGPDGDTSAPGAGRALLAGPWSYVVPVGAWCIGAVLVPSMARFMNARVFWSPIPWRDALGMPWRYDPTGRIGWGTGDYWAIADHGYWLSEHREAAFPLVGLLARWTSWHTGHEIAPAQVVVALVSGLAATVLFWAFLRVRDVGPRAQVVALLLFLTYPFSFLLFGYGYSDPTLVALLLGAFVLAEHRRPVLAGLVGALATASRPNALPLVVGLLVLELSRSGAVEVLVAGWAAPMRSWRPRTLLRLDLRRMRPSQWGVLLSAGGVAAYSIYLMGHAGSPIYWLTAQSYYGHGSVLSPRTWTKVDFLDWPGWIVTNLPWAVNELAAAILLLGAVALVPAVHRRLGPAYSVFVTGVLLIGWVGPRGFAPGGRYLLPALPFLLVVVAEWLQERSRLLALTLSTFVVSSLLLVGAFVLGGWLWLEW